MAVAGTILVVDDRLKSAASLRAWLGSDSPVTVSATYAEAADTVAYLHLAGSPLPALVIGPLAKDGVAFLADLRGQGIDIPTAFYTETRSRDQDAALARQYSLVAILHKPFAEEDRAGIFGAIPAADAMSNLSGGRVVAAEEPRRDEPHQPVVSPAHQRDVLDDLIGGNRTSSVKEGMPQPSRPKLRADELPSGVQRLLFDPMAGAGGADEHKQAEQKPIEARAVTMLVVDDSFGSARMLAERLGAPGQTCKAVPSYADAFAQLERLMMGTLGCELLFGPLSAEGVTAIREYRKRGWQMHVVFFTESASQSQDPRLAAQYGCLAIVRRAGMVEPLERLVADVRGKPRQAAALPLDSAAKSASSRLNTPLVGQLGSAPPAREATPQGKSESSPVPHNAPGTSRLSAGTGNTPVAADQRASALSSRVRRSIGSLPPVSSPPSGAASPPSGGAPPPLQIDVPGDVPSGHERVMACFRCKREFVARFTSLPAKAVCDHCGAPNALK